MKDGIKLKGYYTVNDTIYKNTVGNIVINNLLNNWLYNSGDDNSAKYFVFGNGVPTENGLGNEIFRKIITSRSKGNNTLQSIVQLQINEGNFNYTEIGIVDSLDRILSYATFNFNKTSNATLNVVYTLEIN